MSSTPTRRHDPWGWRSLAGGLGLATMLALGSPGVQVARAEQAPVQSPDSALQSSGSILQSPGLTLQSPGSALQSPDSALQSVAAATGPQSCQAEPRNLPSSSQIDAALQQLQAMVAAEGQGDVVVFNGAGHNYRSGTGPLSEIGRIRAEIARQQAR